MDKFTFEFNGFKIEFDKNYSGGNKTGWSICENGHYIVQLQPKLIWALFQYYAFKLCKSASKDKYT